MTSTIAKHALGKVVGARAQQYEANDPYYHQEVDLETGKKGKKHKRPLPAGLTKEEGKLLTKIRRRAHYLDKGIQICGFRVGWTFFIALIPFLGDLIDALLGYNLIIKPCKKRGQIPDVLATKMQLNTMLATGVGMIPLIGDIIMAAFKANSRNAWLFEEYLIEQVKNRGGALQAPVSNEAQAQQVINRASGGTWSKLTGRNDALVSSHNSQGIAAPPLPERL